MSHHKNLNLLVANTRNFFENMAMDQQQQIKISHKEIQSRLNLGDGCYHCVSLLSLKTLILKYNDSCTSLLYGSESLSVTLREEHRLRLFENRVLRRIFGPKREEVAGDWRKLHSEELHDLYASPNIIRVIK
jgi:hypothetical protein